MLIRPANINPEQKLGQRCGMVNTLLGGQCLLAVFIIGLVADYGAGQYSKTHDCGCYLLREALS